MERKTSNWPRFTVLFQIICNIFLNDMQHIYKVNCIPSEVETFSHIQTLTPIPVTQSYSTFYK